MENQNIIFAIDHTYYLLLAGIGILVIVTFTSIKLALDKSLSLRYKMKRMGELYETFFKDSPVGMIIVRKRDGLVIDCNKAYRELLNCTEEDIINKPPAILENSVGIGRYNSQLNSRAIVGKVIAIELLMKPKDKPEVFTSVSIQPISVSDEPCMVVAIQDMSIYKKAEEDRRRSEEDRRRSLVAEIDLNKMMADFISLASHEFRTPLSTILFSAFLIENDCPDKKQEMLVKHLNRIRSAVSTLTFLIEEFLSLTKIEKKQVVVEPVQVNIKDHMEKLLKDFESLFKHGQQILYEHEGDTVVYTDPILITNIVNILVSNSVKFSSENSAILISTQVRNGFYIKVIDFGMGIPQEDQNLVFERFFRASNAGNMQGVGLGLHILKHYVDMLQGKVKIKSIAQVGTEVFISFQEIKFE